MYCCIYTPADNFDGDFSKITIGSTYDTIMFPWHYNWPLTNVHTIPSNVTNIIFGREFSERITELPPTITYIVFRSQYDYPFDRVFDNVKSLHLGTSCICENDIINFPSKLVYLNLNVRMNVDIPLTVIPSLKHLVLQMFLHRYKKFIFVNNLHIVCPNLETLEISNDVFKPLTGLPQTLKHITLSSIISKEHIFPTSIESFAIISYKYRLGNSNRKLLKWYPQTVYNLLRYDEDNVNKIVPYIAQRCETNMHNRNKRRTGLFDDLL